jgi:hypothetical protein
MEFATESSENPPDVPFPPRRTGEYWKGIISARPLYQGVRRSVWDPETSRERIGDWGGPETVSCHVGERQTEREREKFIDNQEVTEGR